MTLPRSIGLLLGYLCLLTTLLPAQDAEMGLPLVRDFTPPDFLVREKVGSLAQDSLGRIYYAEERQLRIFDGTRFDVYEFPKPELITRFTLLSGDRLLVAREQDIQLLTPEIGQRYAPRAIDGDFDVDSRRQLHDSPILGFAEMGDYVFINGFRTVYAWNQRAQRGRLIYRSDKILPYIFTHEGRLYISNSHEGLWVWDPATEQASAVPGGQWFCDANSSTIVEAVPGPAGAKRLIANLQGSYRFDGTTFTKEFGFGPGNGRGSMLAESAVALTQGWLAVETSSAGIHIYDERGNLAQVLDNGNVLRDNGIVKQLMGRDGGLWVLSRTGLLRFDYNSPFQLYPLANGREVETVMRMVRFEGRITGVTSNRLLFAKPVEGTQMIAFETVSSLERPPVYLLPSPYGIPLVQRNDLLFFRDGAVVRGGTVADTETSVRPSQQEPGIFYFVLPNRVDRMAYDGKSWTLLSTLHGGYGFMGDQHELEPGIVWFELGWGRLVRMDFRSATPTQEFFDPSNGLPANEWAAIVPLGGEVMVRGSQSSIYRLNPKTRRFNPDPQLTALFPMPLKMVRRTGYLADGTVWVSTRSGNGFLRPDGRGSYRWDPIDLGSLEPVNLTNVLDEGRYIWFGTQYGFVRLDQQAPPVERREFPTLLVRVQAGDRVVTFPSNNLGSPLVFNHAENELLFDFAAPSFVDPGRTVFRSRIEGLNEGDWTPWGSSSRKEFSNLPEGRYRLTAQARDSLGVVGTVAQLNFTVLPPWYRTWWAWSIYLLGGGLLISGYIGLRGRALRQRNLWLESEVRQRTADLEEANKAKSRFLANMSHEIRTPMNGVLGMVNILLKTPLNAEQMGFAKVIRDSAESLLAIINDILDLSKIESGKLSLESIDFNLHEMAEDTVQLLAERALAKNLNLYAFIPREVPLWVRGDPTRLRQILLNLIGNAIKFTQQGEVGLRVSFRGDAEEGVRLHFNIIDTGIGIAPEALAKLFQAFVQADVSTTRKFGGTGLGLSISKLLVELMGGRIWVESEEGKGSQFQFEITLPRGRTPGPGVDGSETLAGRRALIIDDSPIEREILADALRGWKMEVAQEGVATRGLAAIAESMRAGRPYELVLIDLFMPEMTGMELIQKVRNDSAYDGMKLLLISSTSHRPTASALHDARVSGFINRPLKNTHLLQSLLQALGGGNVAPQKTREESLKRQSHSLRVLLAEDVITNQKIASILVRQLGHSIDVVDNGRKALEALRLKPYDVVLMDGHMPEMDGEEATERLRRGEGGVLDREVYVIAMTAAAMEGDRERYLACGMNDYVSKPVSEKALSVAFERAIKYCLDKGRELKRLE